MTYEGSFTAPEQIFIMIVPRRPSNGCRAQLSFGRTRLFKERTLERIIRLSGSEVWPDESKCLSRSHVPPPPPERDPSRYLKVLAHTQVQRVPARSAR